MLLLLLFNIKKRNSNISSVSLYVTIEIYACMHKQHEMYKIKFATVATPKAAKSAWKCGMSC